MTNELMKISRTVAVFFLLVMLSISAASAMEYLGPANLEPQLSSDGKTMYNAVPAVVYRVDPNPPNEQVRIPARFDMATLPETATSTFSITYAANGSTDPWGETCITFPEEAKAAFNAAAAIWGNLLNSSVPITISACWSNLGSRSILGYSGGGLSIEISLMRRVRIPGMRARWRMLWPVLISGRHPLTCISPTTAVLPGIMERTA